jgi:DUF1365 family protein
MTGKFQSCIYQGLVQHRRHQPSGHNFSYKVFMMYLDTEEIDHVLAVSPFWSKEKPNLASFRRSDFLEPHDIGIKEAVCQLLEKEGHPSKIHRVRVLANLRYFGVNFNPIVNYYCFDQQDNLVYTVAEVTNTPWLEKHHYVIPYADNQSARNFEKNFHVSPFMPMNMTYRWRNNQPDQKLFLHMENLDENGIRVFDATLSLERNEINRSSLSKFILLHPFMTLKVISGIYWEALRLWIKRNRFFPHPSTT